MRKPAAQGVEGNHLLLKGQVPEDKDVKPCTKLGAARERLLSKDHYI